MRPAHDSRFRTRLADEHGTALIIALMSMMLLTALGAAVVMVSNTETMIANNHRNSQEALYAADAAVERVVQDLLMVPRWNDVLAGTVQSSFIDGAMTDDQDAAGRRHHDALLRTNTATAQLQADTDTLNLWGANNPQWKLFAWGPLSEMLPRRADRQPDYVARLGRRRSRGLRTAHSDGNPLADANGMLTLHAEAIGPGGTRKVDRGDGGAHVEHGNRARADRAARSGRAEPARAQGGRADARQGAPTADDRRHGTDGELMQITASLRRSTPSGGRRGCAAVAAPRAVRGCCAWSPVMLWSATASAQLDPLLFVKRVPPTVIIVVDTSLQMLEDGNGNFYDPDVYSSTADPRGDGRVLEHQRRRRSRCTAASSRDLSYEVSPGRYIADSITATAAPATRRR